MPDGLSSAGHEVTHRSRLWHGFLMVNASQRLYFKTSNNVYLTRKMIAQESVEQVPFVLTSNSISCAISSSPTPSP